MADEKIFVRVNDAIAKYGGALHDPDSKRNPSGIGKEPVAVEKTEFVVARIATGELISVDMPEPLTIDTDVPPAENHQQEPPAAEPASEPETTHQKRNKKFER